MDIGYERLDCENSPSNATENAEVLKENGIKKFTFSSTWSEAVEDACKFKSAGYRIEGVTKTLKQHLYFLKNKKAILITKKKSSRREIGVNFL